MVVKSVISVSKNETVLIQSVQRLHLSDHCPAARQTVTLYEELHLLLTETDLIEQLSLIRHKTVCQSS